MALFRPGMDGFGAGHMQGNGKGLKQRQKACRLSALGLNMLSTRQNHWSHLDLDPSMLNMLVTEKNGLCMQSVPANKHAHVHSGAD